MNNVHSVGRLQQSLTRRPIKYVEYGFFYARKRRSNARENVNNHAGRSQIPSVNEQTVVGNKAAKRVSNQFEFETVRMGVCQVAQVRAQ